MRPGPQAGDKAVVTSRQVIDDLLRGRQAERVGLMDSPWVVTR
jgi:hypothetical protein